MEPVQPEASVVQTGLGIKYVGTGDRQYAYAYSGETVVGGSETTVLEFTTGSGLLRAELQITNESGSDNDFITKVYFNDLLIAGTKYLSAYPMRRHGWDRPLFIIIPPQTLVKVSVLQTSGSPGSDPWFGCITGRVYGTKE